MRLFLILIMSLWAVVATAQTWPDYRSTTVNDYADLLDDTAEAQLTDTLNTLRADTGVEMTVLTITRQDLYTYGMTPPPTIEDFATGLFNQWGIGNAETNDGVLILVARGDREMRIELGGAYGQGWNDHAARVLDRSFLPLFKEDKYQQGILKGVDDTIENLVTPFLAGEDAPSGGPEIGWLLVAAFAAFLFGKPLWQTARQRMARCVSCGRRGQHIATDTIFAATTKTGGRERRRVTCPHCGNHSERFFDTSPIRASSSSSSSSFGGGSSGGCGATGRW